MAGPIDDLALARTLLGGFLKNGHHHYLDPGDEGRARKALVRELLSERPLDRDLRVMLAAMFGPDPIPLSSVALYSDEGHQMFLTAERVLSFGFRSKKRRSPIIRDLMIASWVETRMEGSSISVEGATAEAADKFGLSDDAVKKARKRAKTIIAM